jgi:enoyl-CoA hydratase/carnithine racemase
MERGSIAVVTLHRPERRNAVTLAMWRDLRRLFGALGRDRSVRALVLTGAGGHFCAGADIGEFPAVRRGAAAGAAYTRAVEACTEALMAVPRPTVAAIEGVCLGGGSGLAMACDFRVARAGARFGIPAARLGIVYGVLDSRNLVALVGVPRARAILFGGRPFDTAEALRIGFVDRVVAGRAKAAALDLAASFVDSAPLAVAGAKLTLNAIATGRTGPLAAEIRAAARRAAASRDYREAVRAFAEKRRPVFVGA